MRSLIRDPAPSRTAYRMQRMLLTPSFRWAMKYGVPVLVPVVLLVSTIASEERRQDVWAWANDIKRQIEARPEFQVRMMRIEGAAAPIAAEIRAAFPIDLPASSFDIDLDALREGIADIPAVASADVRIRSGGVLDVTIVERRPVALWRDTQGLRLLSGGGIVLGAVERRSERPELPLLAGAGADVAVGQAMAILSAAEPIAGRIRGLRRMGERRWDIVLDRDQVVMLPAGDPVGAVERMIALHAAQDLLARDITHVDMRNADRVTVRLAPAAVASLRAIRAIEAGATGMTQ